MTDFSAPKYNRENSATDVRFRRVLILSVVLHVLVLVGIPLMSQLLRKEKEFKRPHTFQLVQPPQPIPPARKTPPPPPPPEEVKPEPQPPQPEPQPQPAPPKPEPKPQPKPEPKPTPPKPDPKPQPKVEEVAEPVKPAAEEPPPPEPPPPPPVEENLDDLAALFESLPAPAQISAPGNFRFHWYLNNVRSKIEQNWRPATEDRTLEVIVRFYINSDGSAAGLSISKSSGNSTLDNLAIRAVTVSSPFGKLPPGFSGDRLDINLTLRPTSRR